MIHYLYAAIILAMLAAGWYGKGLIDDSWQAKIDAANAKIDAQEAAAKTQIESSNTIIEVRHAKLEPKVKAVQAEVGCMSMEISDDAAATMRAAGLLVDRSQTRLQPGPSAGSAAPADTGSAGR